MSDLQISVSLGVLQNLIDATEKLIDINDEPKDGAFCQTVGFARSAIAKTKTDDNKNLRFSVIYDNESGTMKCVRWDANQHTWGDVEKAAWPNGNRPGFMDVTLSGQILIVDSDADEIDLTPANPIAEISGATTLLLSNPGFRVETTWAAFVRLNAMKTSEYQILVSMLKRGHPYQRDGIKIEVAPSV